MRRLAPALAVTALVACGCGDTTIDAGKAEAFVRSAIGPPAPTSVHCPGGVTAKKGETIVCRVVLPGGRRYTATLHILDSSRVRLSPRDVRPTP
jgi:hypothetical protein